MMKKAEDFADKYRAEFWTTSSRTGQRRRRGGGGGEEGRYELNS